LCLSSAAFSLPTGARPLQAPAVRKRQRREEISPVVAVRLTRHARTGSPDRGRTIFSTPGEAKTYKDLPHGMPTTHAEIVNAERNRRCDFPVAA
jgi:hypothetical protein